MSNIQIGGKLGRTGRSRIERPYSGVIAGLSINRLRVLDLASERDPHITLRGDVQLVTGVLDRNDLQRMQQVRYLLMKKKKEDNFQYKIF
jgi:neurexin